MSLITSTYVKANFEPWELFCTVEGSASTAMEILELKIALAEAEFSQYISVSDPAELTDELQRHLLNLVRKQCFDIKHGDTEYKNPPQILKDYEASIAALKLYGPRVDDDVETNISVSFTSKERKFNTWFNERNEGDSGIITTPE